MRVYDLIFLLDIVRTFLTEFTKDGETVPCRDLMKIAVRYLDSDFKMDFICWLPFWELGVNFKVHKFARVLFIVKCYRIFKAMRIFDVS